MKSRARQPEDKGESGRQRPELCRSPGAGWVPTGDIKAMEEGKKFEVREIGGNEGNHLPEILAVFISITPQKLFDRYLLSLS